MPATFGDLSHATRDLRGGVSVLVLDTGALITPEAQAMLAARYSRSPFGVKRLLAEMFKRDAREFLREHYQVGYGHKSIGELGDAAIFVDGVSMLAAKAIEDHPLYRGQESSTRYIDFSKQPFYDPLYYRQERRAAKILEDWRALYLAGMDVVAPDLVRRFPRKDGEEEKTYKQAIKARTFDVMRAFLPAGATTNVAWVGDLRHINDHLTTLRNHPLEEVRGVAEAVEDALIEKFPASFGAALHEDDPKKLSMIESVNVYERQMGAIYGYFHEPSWPHFEVERDAVDLNLLRYYGDALRMRPRKGELPFAIRECGSLRFKLRLDFGSYRDLQRHRALVTRMPLLTSDLNFGGWYLSELPQEFREKAILRIEEQLDAIGQLKMSELDRQYYLPMGMQTCIRMTGDLRALVYFAELRGTRFVHPTLRTHAIQVANVLHTRFGASGLKLHLDPDPDRFDVRRGGHDITRK